MGKKIVGECDCERDSLVLKVVGVVAGLAVAACAALAWHYWQMDGFISFMVALGGLGLAAKSIDVDFGDLFNF